MNIDITYIIGTNDIGAGPDEIEGAEDYRAEVEQRLREAFPEARHVDAVIENGRSVARVGGLDWQVESERVDAIMAEIWRIADEVWSHGNWRSTAEG